MIDNQIYLIHRTKTLSVTAYNKNIRFKYPSGVYWHNERLERKTWNALVTLVFSAFPSHG